VFSLMPDVDKIKAGLNPQQQLAVETTDGPVLVIAGAGSGKTSVLTRRIAYLVGHNRVPPWAILAITFTNKAAREMNERIEQLVGPIAADIWATTFHAMCVRILRRDIERLGYQRDFSILDATDQLSTIKRILNDLNIDSKRYEPKAILSAISAAKNVLQTAAKVRDSAANPFEKIVGDVYLEYERKLKINQSLDFDDLIMKTVHLFQTEPDVLQFYQRKFQYIHVDEYQDTNHAQYRLVSLMASQRKNICVVGDSDQSIYGWRGADIQNILQFERDYPDAKVIRLEQNYRSTKTVLRIANAVIKNNHERRAKELWTDNAEGDKAVLHKAFDERAEARFIVDKIESFRASYKRRFQDFAVLYRTNAQSRVIEEAFLQQNIPYRIFGGLKFYERKEIKDILSYLRLIANPDDDISLRRIINVPKRGIGDGSLSKLQDFADAYGLSLFSALEKADQAGIRGKILNALRDFVQLMDHLMQMRPYLSVTELTEAIIERSGYKAALKAEKSLEAEARIENLDEFLTVTGEFDARFAENVDDDKLGTFLTDVALIADTDLNGGRPEQTNGEELDQVVLMTLHSAKGLEFPVVFLPGLEEGLFPHGRVLDSEHDMEEERRLCYVGVTRAKESLFLSTCGSRTIFGQYKQCIPSRFLAEMPSDALEQDSLTSGTTFGRNTNAEERGRYSKQPMQPVEKRSYDYSAGDKVEHRKWGIGTVISVTGSAEDTEVTIAFPAPTGIKRLMAQFAPIQKLVENS
jgi:DNA helicase-2/ATP-dependent DNA helicase PcrA